MARASRVVPIAAGAAAAAAAGARVRTARRKRAKQFGLLDGEPAGDGLRRIARAQLDLIAEDPEDVHEVRKALKRLRALLRLARDEVGADVRRRENATLRDAGRRLADARDAEVLLATFDGLVEPGAFPALRHELHAIATRAAARDRGEDTGAVVQTAAETRERVASWSLGDDPAPLKRGFKRIRRRGRRAYRAASGDPADTNLHELRKRTKDVRHAAEILGRNKLARRAHKLGDLLGDDHDLVMLLDVSRRLPAALNERDRELFERLIERRRTELRSAALQRASRLY
jgi:CHAD domain-containing protein